MSRWKTAAVCAVVVAGLGACQRPAEPRDVVVQLLRLHGLEGRTPQQRPQWRKKTAVPPDALRPLVADYDAYDAFTRDLYLGVVLGALANAQQDLRFVEKDEEAVVQAGALPVVLVRTDGRWQVHLGRTMPRQVRQRAAIAKKQYEAARRAAGP